jgi:3-dehydroquinate dehydratase-2
MKKILVIHGPNLNLLGTREKSIYGDTTIEQINEKLKAIAHENKFDIDFFQSNHEGDIVDRIGKAPISQIAGIILNPAAYTHTSVAIRDAVSAIDIPVVEVHLSNIYSREEFRHTSLIAPVAFGQISGFGVNSYILGLKAVISVLQKND